MGQGSGFGVATARIGRRAAGVRRVPGRVAFGAVALARLLLAPVQIGAQCRGQPLLALRLAVVHRLLANAVANLPV